jgi:hypothetical protein
MFLMHVLLCFLRITLGRKSRSSGWTSYRFDSVAKYSEFPDHSCRTALLGLFRHCRAAFFIPTSSYEWSSSPGEFHPEALTGRVEYWRHAL